MRRRLETAERREEEKSGCSRSGLVASVRARAYGQNSLSSNKPGSLLKAARVKRRWSHVLREGPCELATG